MSKLLVGHKEAIRNSVIAKTFEDRWTNLEKEKQQLFQECLSNHIRPHRASWAKIPNNWKDRTVGVSIQVGSERHYLPAEKECFVPADFYGKKMPANSLLGKKIIALSRKADKLCKDERELKQKTNAVLNSCTTIKKLIKVWPEAVQHYDFAAEGNITNLPAVRGKDLNALIEKMVA